MNTLNAGLRVAAVALFTFFSALLLAQDYRPTAVEGANWIIIDSETPHWPNSHFVRTFEGDTVVNGLTYKKHYEYVIDYVEEQFGPAFDAPYELLPGRELIALVRDDVAARRVYGIVTNFTDSQGSSGEDILLHNYSLEVGDTLVGLNFGTTGSLIVEEVGIEMRFGTERRYQKAANQTFYEGIGSLELGPTSGGSLFQTNCCDIRLVDYCAGEFASCSIESPNVTRDFSENHRITIFPNPVSNELNVASTNPFSVDVNIKLTDVTGRVLRTESFRQQVILSIPELVPGMYLLTFTMGERQVVRKFVKR